MNEMCASDEEMKCHLCGSGVKVKPGDGTDENPGGWWCVNEGCWNSENPKTENDRIVEWLDIHWPQYASIARKAVRGKGQKN